MKNLFTKWVFTKLYLQIDSSISLLGGERGGGVKYFLKGFLATHSLGFFHVYINHPWYV